VKPVAFRPQAVRDLEAIADYIAADNPTRAPSFVQEIRERCRLLGDFPESARRFPELGKDARILPYGNYVIIYRNLPQQVLISRVIHGARDILAALSDSD
jgi:toxin ParE1/3/4